MRWRTIRCVRSASWPDYSTHYGPVFTGLSVVAAWLGGGRPIGTALAFKTLAAAGGALTAWAAAALAKRDGRDGLLPLLLVAWNPLALLETAGSGHNEMVMIGLALLGLLWCARGRTTLGLRPAGRVRSTSSGSPPRWRAWSRRARCATSTARAPRAARARQAARHRGRCHRRALRAVLDRPATASRPTRRLAGRGAQRCVRSRRRLGDTSSCSPPSS